MKIKFAKLIAATFFCVLILDRLVSESAGQESGELQQDVLNLIDPHQAIVIQIDQSGDLAHELSGLAFFQHPSYLEVQDYLKSETFTELMQASDLPWQPIREQLGEQFDAEWERAFAGPITLAINIPNRRTVNWLVTFPSKIESFDELVTTILQPLGSQAQELLDRGKEENDYEGVSIVSLNAMSGSAFFWQQQWFVCSDFSGAKTMVDRLQGRTVPKRPFSTNRKFATGRKQAESVSGVRLAQIYVDPELCRHFLPFIPDDYFEIAGLPEISSLFIEINRPQKLEVGSSTAEISVDAWFGIRMPPQGVFAPLFNGTGFASLPDIELEKPLEVLAISVDHRGLFETLAKRFDEVSGETDLLSRTVDSFEKSSDLKPDFLQRVLEGSNGQFLSITLGDVRAAPLLICGVNDRAAVAEAIPQVLKQLSGSSQLLPELTQNDGVDYWLWSESQIEQYQEKLTRKIRRGQPNFKADESVQPFAFSLSDDFLTYSIGKTVNDLGNIRPVEAGSNPFAGELLGGLYQHDENLFQPSLIWITSPDYWRSYVALMNYNAELDATKTKLEDVAQIKALREQILIRLADAASGSLGRIVVVGKAEDSGLRLSGLLFSQTETN